MRTHKALASLALVAALAPSTGCYFGRSPSAKSGAYVANGLALALGGAFLLSASTDDDCPPDADVSCGVGRGLASGSQAGAGVLFLLGGAIGIAVNLLVPTKHPAPAAPAPARSAMAGSIWTVEASPADEPSR